MPKTWLELIRKAGDRTVGQAMVRMARQASSVHLMESMKTHDLPPDRSRVVGADPRPVVSTKDGGSVDKEVNR